MAKKRDRLQPALFADDVEEEVSPDQGHEEEQPIPPLLIIRNAAQLVCVSRQGEHVKRGNAMRNLALIEGGAVVVRDGRIEWVGHTTKLPRVPADERSAGGPGSSWVSGLARGHTHLIFAGSRED